MAIGNLVNIGNKIKITAGAVIINPIVKTLDLLVHPAKGDRHWPTTCITKVMLLAVMLEHSVYGCA